ncbi:MAG: ABC transporter ATP-binding protein [Chloroflexota bacterium]
MIELRDVTRSYKMGHETIHALDGVSLTVAEGEFVAVLGPSGSGKSTLLHVVGGLDTPTTGTIVVNGQDLSRATDRELSRYRNAQVGFVFQTFNLQSTLTALENVALPLVFARAPRKERLARARETLEAIGLADRMRHKPTELSGGERQRVSIARALANQPRLLLADEPTGNLDSTTGMGIVELLVRLNRERGLTVIVVTHDPDVAAFAGRHIALRDGRIVQDNGEAAHAV